MTKKASQILQAYQQSMGAQTSEWIDLMAEDIVFQGPVDRIEGKEANIKLNTEFGKLIRGIDHISLTENENLVSTQMVFKLETPSGKIIELEIAEFYTIENGKIKSIRIYYDPTEYKKEFGLE